MPLPHVWTSAKLFSCMWVKGGKFCHFYTDFRLIVKQILWTYINHSYYDSPDGIQLQEGMKELAIAALLMPSTWQRAFTGTKFYVCGLIWPGIKPTTFYNHFTNELLKHLSQFYAAERLIII